jgi:hypothetical protein
MFPLLVSFEPFLISCRTDYVLFVFLEDYFGRLEGPIAMQVWGRFVTLAKEIAGNVYGFKLQVFPCLRYVRPARTTDTPEVNDIVGALQPFLKLFPIQLPSMIGRPGEKHKYVQKTIL